MRAVNVTTCQTTKKLTLPSLRSKHYVSVFYTADGCESCQPTTKEGLAPHITEGGALDTIHVSIHKRQRPKFGVFRVIKIYIMNTRLGHSL